jgi:hypothetical protein
MIFRLFLAFDKIKNNTQVVSRFTGPGLGVGGKPFLPPG